ncbi:hypothetical protein P7L68_03715 (plasmid) [Tistrella mobilis]|uniref:hypothetical protein n=1 Tax=Tistrella mobilis TaxID=171437 RepID=UPI0035564113
MTEARKAKLKALHETIQAAIAEGDGVGEEEMDRLLDAEEARLRKAPARTAAGPAGR